ncbi:hypothetical protein AAFF_G00091130 [Aldrovandia affinis]|uniref:Uncharacterized protein n=1 Tax=Aldrovandia affinis TaxID=143900 RepID=A0AAD7RYH5_9TELE|nr:hypothetical protein AAFF_G00091130 [Aldrovandia affinis]
MIWLWLSLLSESPELKDIGRQAEEGQSVPRSHLSAEAKNRRRIRGLPGPDACLPATRGGFWEGCGVCPTSIAGHKYGADLNVRLNPTQARAHRGAPIYNSLHLPPPLRAQRVAWRCLTTKTPWEFN